MSFKCLGSLLTRDGYYTREIKKRIVIAKEAFNRKICHLASKLNIELNKKLVLLMFGALPYMAHGPGLLRILECKHLESFEIW